MEIKSGFKKTEVGVIPEDWDTFCILQNSTIKARIGWQGLTTAEYLNTGDYLLITGTDFNNDSINWESCNYVSKERFLQDKNIQIKDGDILITKDGTIGKVAFVKNLPMKGTLNSGVFVIRPINNSYFPRFLFYIFTSFYFDDFLRKLVAGSTINHLYQKDFISFRFPLPNNRLEQTAIATALSDTDALIESLEKLIEKKRNIKKGVMQELLTGKRRLEGYCGEWKNKKLGEITIMFSGGTPLTTNPSFYNGYIPWAVIADITKAGKYIYETEKHISDLGVVSSAAKLFKKGTILFAMYASIGKCTIARMDTTFNQAILGINTKSIDTEFLYYFLAFNESRFALLGQTGTQSNLNKEIVQNIVIPLPEPDEQKAISTTLKHIDEEVEVLQQKLNKFRMIKQGMMQVLLTGKIRLV